MIIYLFISVLNGDSFAFHYFFKHDDRYNLILLNFNYLLLPIDLLCIFLCTGVISEY